MKYLLILGHEVDIVDFLMCIVWWLQFSRQPQSHKRESRSFFDETLQDQDIFSYYYSFIISNFQF